MKHQFNYLILKNMNNLKIFILYFELLIYIKSENILEQGATQESSDGYIIFNSQSIELDKEMNFKIKATSFNLNFVKYCYITQSEDLNTFEENLFKSEFNLEKKENENDFETNYFTIIKNESEFNSNEGNYLVIFYYSSNSKAEITNIKENIEQQKEEEKLGKYETIALVVVFIIGIVITIYCFCCKDKKKSSSPNNTENRNNQIINFNNFQNPNYNSDLYPQSNRNFPDLEHHQKHHGIIPFQIIPEVGNIQRIFHHKDKKIESLKRENLKLMNQNIKFEKEKLETQAEKYKKELLEEQEKKNLENYLNKVRNKFENCGNCEVIIAFERKIKIEELIALRFYSGDSKVNFIAICTKDEIFNTVVNKIFEKIPEFKDYNNYFLGNGNKIKEYKSLEDNKIIKDQGILVYINKEND